MSAAVDAHNAIEGKPACMHHIAVRERHGHEMTRYGRCPVPGSTKVAFTFVRGNSDYLYPAPLEISPGVYEDNPNSPAQNFDTQYGHLPHACLLEACCEHRCLL